MAAQFPKRASLLGLPRELRLIIYKHVYCAEIENGTLIELWEDEFNHGFKSVPLRSEIPLRIPWLGLTLACKTTAIEIRSAMSEASFLESPKCTTYSLQLQPGHYGRVLGKTRMIRLPCEPHTVRFLACTYSVDQKHHFWGDGGPRGIVRGLYQVLNHMIHCGPRLDSRHVLEDRMHIDELSIEIETSVTLSDTDGLALFDPVKSRKDAETTMYSIGSLVGQVVNTGVLKGSVDHIRMVCNDKVLHWHPESVDGAGIPSEWDNYGFDWGMAAYAQSG